MGTLEVAVAKSTNPATGEDATGTPGFHVANFRRIRAASPAYGPD